MFDTKMFFFFDEFTIQILYTTLLLLLLLLLLLFIYLFSYCYSLLLQCLDIYIYKQLMISNSI